MTLADQVTTLGRDALARFDAVDAYYFDTLCAWDLVRTLSRRHGSFKVTPGTGEVRPAVSVADLAARSEGYVATFLNVTTFQQYLGVFEDYLFGLLRLWLTAHPLNVGNKQIDLKSLLAAGSLDAAVGLFVDKELNDVLYKRPAEWFAYLNEKVKLGVPSADEVARFTEAKASRDVLTHGNGVVTAQYVDKSGTLARYAVGEFIDIPDDYHRDTVGLLRKMAADLTAAAAARAG